MGLVIVLGASGRVSGFWNPQVKNLYVQFATNLELAAKFLRAKYKEY